MIGAGVFGRLRARAIRSNPKCRLGAVADLDAGRLRDLTGPGVAAFSDYRALLQLPDLDAVVVSSPVPLHEEMAIAALRAGKHVICEKPLAASVASCRRILEAARAADRTLAVGFNYRYFPSIAFVKRAVETGRLGPIDHVRLFGGHIGLSEFRAEWMYRGESLGGGAMMDIGIHLVDLARYLVGEIRQVYGVSTHRVWKVPGAEDNALALFETAAGVPVSCQATWCEWKGYRFRIEVYGSRGMAMASLGPMMNRLVLRDEGGAPSRGSWKLYPRINLRDKLFGWQDTAQRALALELDDFMARLAGRPSAAADGLDGLRAVEVAQAVYESHRSGRPVPLGS